nr:hypothetical protein [Nocardia sputi]
MTDAVDQDAVGGFGEFLQVAARVDAVGDDPVVLRQQQPDRRPQGGQVLLFRRSQRAENHRDHRRAVQCGGEGGGSVAPGHRCGVLGQREQCDAPGEWIADRESAQAFADFDQRHQGEEFQLDPPLGQRRRVPAACRCDERQCAGTSAAGEFHADPTAERVARDMAGAPAQFVELIADLVGERVHVDGPAVGGCAAPVAGERGREHLAVRRQPRRGLFPGVRRHHESVQQQQGVAGTEM